MSAINRKRLYPTIGRRSGRSLARIPPNGKNINTYLPMELLREIFIYGIESNQMESGQLAYVCRYWQSAVASTGSLWSTLRIGTWTDKERVSTWLQRAYPKKIVIDTMRDHENPSEAPAFAALQNALTSTDHWHELTISSFPPEDVSSQLSVQVASPMNELKVLHVAAGCVNSPSLAHLLSLVPNEAPLRELRLHPPFASTHFLQPHWFPVLQNLTVLIVSGRDMDEPFELLPTLTQLQIFEADHLSLPFYDPNTNLPLVCTLRKLRLRACSVQWMAGREFPCLEECICLFPRHWEVIQQHEVRFPSSVKLTYHGHPMSTAQYFYAPKLREMELRSHDCDNRRVYQHLRPICRVHGRNPNLTTLHLTLQCSERVLGRVLKYLVSLRELNLSIAHPSPSWKNFLESLAAKPSTNEWPTWDQWKGDHQKLERWCSSQTWHAKVLPHLKFLGIQCPKGFSKSECLENLPFLRLVGWTRARLTPPLEHLKVWEGRGSTDDIAVEYISTGYQYKHLGILRKFFDAMIVMGIATRGLVIHDSASLLFQIHPTGLFRQLQHLELIWNDDYEIPILPHLEQIKTLELHHGRIPEYSLNLDLPLTRTLQGLYLRHTTSSWMLGRTFKTLRQFRNYFSLIRETSGHEGLQVNLPACTRLELDRCPMDYLRSLSCSNVQKFYLILISWVPSDLTVWDSLHDFVFILSCLQKLYIEFLQPLETDSFLRFVFHEAREQEVWRDIRSVEVKISSNYLSEASDFIDQAVEHQQCYKKWWKAFTVTKGGRIIRQVKIRASR
jgi:hypothetical protein